MKRVALDSAFNFQVSSLLAELPFGGCTISHFGVNHGKSLANSCLFRCKFHLVQHMCVMTINDTSECFFCLAVDSTL